MNKFLNKEPENHRDKTLFHLLGGIADLTLNRFRGIKDLPKSIPSILYYSYIDDVITEDFWIKYAIKNTLPPIYSILSPKRIKRNSLIVVLSFLIGLKILHTKMKK